MSVCRVCGCLHIVRTCSWCLMRHTHIMHFLHPHFIHISPTSCTCYTHITPTLHTSLHFTYITHTPHLLSTMHPHHTHIQHSHTIPTSFSHYTYTAPPLYPRHTVTYPCPNVSCTHSYIMPTAYPYHTTSYLCCTHIQALFQLHANTILALHLTPHPHIMASLSLVPM